MIPHYEPHPIALLFPPHGETEQMEMRASLRDHGFDKKRKITLYEGKILDGVGRYNGCVAEDVQPEFDEFKGADPLAFAVRMNLRGIREWTVGQKALLGAKLLPQLQEEARNRQSKNWGAHPPKTSENNGESGSPRIGGTAPSKHDGEAAAQAAKAVGVSRNSVAAAAAVIANGVPTVLEAVAHDLISLETAKRVMKLSKASQKRICSAYQLGDAEGKHALVVAEARKREAKAQAAAKPPSEFDLNRFHRAIGRVKVCVDEFATQHDGYQDHMRAKACRETLEHFQRAFLSWHKSHQPKE